MNPNPLTPNRFESGRAMLLAGIRQQHGNATAASTIPAQWRQFQAQGKPPGQVGSVTYGVICSGDATGLEYMCAAEVDSFEKLPEGMGRMRILPQEYAVFVHEGPISAISQAWDRILKEWLPTSGHESAHKPDFERYDERYDPVSGTGTVEIWVSIVK